MTIRRSRPWTASARPLLTFAVFVLCAQEGRAAGLGMSRATAIEVCGLNGAHDYFDRLLCSDGGLVKYEVMGNEGLRNDPTSKADRDAAHVQSLTSAPIPAGQRDFHRVDGYTVECSAGPATLYVDSSHCPGPKNQGPPPGYAFVVDPAQAPPVTPSGERGLGLAKANAIEVCGPKGARDYLDRLRCPDDSKVRSQRTGNMGLRNDPASAKEDEAAREQLMTVGPVPGGQRDFHLVDGYNAECPTFKKFLYLDPYHCPDPKYQDAPPGFSINAGRTAS